MKILELIIKDPQGKPIEEIKFNEVGVSFIYGDIQDSANLKGTINSLGKTLLLKFVDYIFGANEDLAIVKEPIHGFKLEATVKYESKYFTVLRILGNSEEIYIDGNEYSLSEYKDFFQLKRRLLGKQIILSKKLTEISQRTSASKDDIISCLELLNLKDILEEIGNIYESQDRIKELKKNKKELVSFYGNFDVKQIDGEIYFIDKEVERLTKELKKVSNKIKTIEIADIQKDVVEEYSEKSKELKRIKRTYEMNKFESDRLLQFIEDSNQVDISSEHILAIFNKAKQEVPDMVKKTIDEVEEFHRKVYEERKDFLNQRRSIILSEMEEMNKKIYSLSTEINRIGAIISENEIYKESIELYEKYNNDLQEVKYRQGKLSQVKNIDDAIAIEDSNLSSSFSHAAQLRKEYDSIIQEYRDFIFDITKSIYDTDVNSYFDIKIRNKHLRNRPVIFEFTLKGDTGEGVGEVKKNLMDYLICRYNNQLEVMIQDSSCYNGIDPRQIVGMLGQLNNISEVSNKQIIVSVNKYQLGNYDSVIKEVEEKSSIILSENRNLLGFEF
ncbi:DUF2326 domain-containing protein [Peptoniphilus harei]|uniref:DUF2326 domain-containing protein n=1 Tax=Peptoniphilus TaxID=162289 RepID=UPI00189963F1|nr:DUF2326 domain-containing protein [Peptoniphilus harei]MDK7377864.1 DUF2326 domain-containing protein [Peptoniphilus harei]MDK7680175.1 DUF2326 domain-containing protein [Peptoniphilus harei]MDU3457926.1 DUF2326 domain-containing protein [Peptoniphilus harei]